MHACRHACIHAHKHTYTHTLLHTIHRTKAYAYSRSYSSSKPVAAKPKRAARRELRSRTINGVCEWLGFSACVTWHLHVWHDSFAGVTALNSLIMTSRVARCTDRVTVCVWHNSSIWMSQFTHTWSRTVHDTCVTWVTRDMTHTCDITRRRYISTHLFLQVWQIFLISVVWPLHMCDKYHLHVWYTAHAVTHTATHTLQHTPRGSAKQKKTQRCAPHRHCNTL